MHAESVSPLDVLRTYGKVAVKAHEKTNCVTELLLPEAESWVQSEVNLQGPLAGIPVSLKDSLQIKGFDTTLGYTKYACKPYKEDGPMTKLLKDAGMAFLSTELLLQHAVANISRGCALRQDRVARDPVVL